MSILKTDAIQWHEGMLLLPQHFQQNDVRLRELMHFHISEISPYHWGLHAFEFDTSLLVNGLLKISVFEAIMPDGLVASLREDEDEVIEYDLTKHRSDIEKEPQLVYAAIPRYVHGKANALNDTSRFLSKPGLQVVDENTGDGHIEIPRLIPNISIYVGKKPPSTHAFFPIMRIGIESNAYVKKEFIPPILKVASTTTLGKVCKDISTRIREKVAYLTERMLSRAEGYMTRDAEGAARVLSSGLIPFEAMLSAQAAHPFQLYIALCNLSGHVAGLHPAQIPPVLPPYDQNDLHGTYQRLIDYVFSMIDRIQEGYVVVPFTPSGRDFTLKMRKEWLEDKVVLGAKAPLNMSLSELTKWIEGCVIVGDDYVGTAMDNRVLGLQRRIITDDDRLQLVPAKGVILFEATIDPKFVKSDESLHVFNVSDTDALRPVEVVMYVPKNT